MSTINAIRKIGYSEEPEFLSLLLLTFLFKLGGQVTVTLGEIYKIQTEFPEIRFALQDSLEDDPVNARLTATLRSIHVENDKPQ